MTDIGDFTVEWSGSVEDDAPLVVLLHGWGENEVDMSALVPSLPIGPAYASVRAPYRQGRHYSWFAAGRSFDDTLAWFRLWLDGIAPTDRTVVLVGFSAGAAFGGGALISDPERFAGAAVLFGTLPFDAGVATPPGRLAGKDVFLAQGTNDPMIPHDLLDRAWKYLTEESGARVHALRYEGGHELSGESLQDLRIWITSFSDQ